MKWLVTNNETKNLIARDKTKSGHQDTADRPSDRSKGFFSGLSGLYFGRFS